MATPDRPVGYPADCMGPRLRAFVEAELLDDLRRYGVSVEGVSFDWSHPCQEGHQLDYLDGRFEEMSDVAVLDADGEPLAEGWVDFVPTTPPRVFWLFLDARVNGVWQRLKDKPTVPPHLHSG